MYVNIYPHSNLQKTKNFGMYVLLTFCYISSRGVLGTVCLYSCSPPAEQVHRE